MSKEKKNPGFDKNTSLATRMKTYEAITTETKLIERLPIYCRVDMRAGHSFCRGLDKPFDKDYTNAMRAATSYIVEETGAVVGYTQSDEASFVYLDDTKIPFGTRLFKLESVIASMFTGAFYKACLGTKLEKKVWKILPTFDARFLNLPSLSEAANMILWREKDSIKNSITLLALEHFSDKRIHGKNSNEKIEMLHDIGVFYYSMAQDLRNGAYFRREVYDKILSKEELAKIPEKQLANLKKNNNGEYVVTRSHVVQFFLGTELMKIENKEGVLFNREEAILKV